jgi:hypothetical protein
MKPSNKTIRLLFATALTLLTLLSGGSAYAGIAEVTHLAGTLTVRHADGKEKLLAVKSEINEGDTLSTQDETYARIKFIDGGEIVLRPNSQFKVENYRYEEAKPESDNIFVSLLKGGLRAATGLVGKRNKEKIAYKTPTATIGIRGTHFGALYCQGDCGKVKTPANRPLADGLHLDVATGIVSVTNPAGTADFSAGQFGYVRDANTPPQILPPEQGFRVTMPLSIAVNRGFGDGIGETSCSECVVE